jgi:hypothetical protein
MVYFFKKTPYTISSFGIQKYESVCQSNLRKSNRKLLSAAITMTNGMDPPPHDFPNKRPDPDNVIFSFETDEWLDPPKHDANNSQIPKISSAAGAFYNVEYQKTASKASWNRYVHLFGRPTQDLATSPGKRKLKATNLTQVTAYINKMYELLLAHNAFERVERLLYLGDHHQNAERLDKDVVAASLAAEDALPQFGEPAWLVELKKAQTLVQLLTKSYRVCAQVSISNATVRLLQKCFQLKRSHHPLHTAHDSFGKQNWRSN